MKTKPYKAMLDLTDDERRALNTFAAIASLTPNRYVETVLLARLRKDGTQLGLTVPPREGDPPIPGQLAIYEPPPARKAAAQKTKKESAPRRRTRS